MARLVPRQGYLMLYTGFVLGLLAFAALSAYYRPRGGAGGELAQAPESVEVVVLYSSEKQSWLEEVTPRFEEWFKARYNVAVRVVLIPAGSHETVHLILHGTVKPTVWSPASSIWIPYLNKKWRELHGGGDIAAEWVPLVMSPVVIAGWESAALRHNVTCLRDLYELAKGGVDFKWGHPDPLLSNGGAMVVLLEFCEAAGKRPSELTVADVFNETVMEFVRTIESRAVRYGKSTGFFGAWAVEGGPSAITFFGVYESVVIDHAAKAKAKWGERLIAIYPRLGTLMSDHPFVILNASWVTPWQRLAALEYLNFLLQPEAQRRAQAHGFRPANPSVPLDVEVFCERNGVALKPDVPVLEPPRGEVLEAIFEVWPQVKRG